MTTTNSEIQVRQAVRERYAGAATKNTGCCAPSCCGKEAVGNTDDVSRKIGYTEEDLRAIPDEANLGLGCGNPTAIASLQQGQTVLDLGAGAGIDCFLASRQVGPTGKVIGVDMTPEMVARARANAESGGYTNVEFRLGEIEALPVGDESVDVIISNCVLNLVPTKGRALAEAYRVLKRGGQIVISDMVSDLPVPPVLEGNLDAVAACLPTFRERYLQQFRDAGFREVRITSEKAYPASYILGDPKVAEYIAAHPDEAAELAAFAGSIVGAHFEASKT